MKTSFFHSFRDFFHTINRSTSVLCINLSVNEIIYIIRAVYHDFAHEHVFQVLEGAIVGYTVEAFMGLEEI